MTVTSSRLFLGGLLCSFCACGNFQPEAGGSSRKDAPPSINEARSAMAAAEDVLEPDSSRSATAPNEMAENDVPVEVICRESWGASKPARDYSRHVIDKLTVHHQGVVFEDNTLAPRRIRSMQRYHQGSEKNFADIAYHYVVDLEGNIYEGRPTWASGETETDYDPTGHLLVCLLGNFELQTPTLQQIKSLVSLLSWASKEFKVLTTAIEGHRDHAHTLCPGKNLHRMISTDIRSQVSDAERTEFRMTPICGDAGKTRISDIANPHRAGSKDER